MRVVRVAFGRFSEFAVNVMSPLIPREYVDRPSPRAATEDVVLGVGLATDCPARLMGYGVSRAHMLLNYAIISV